MRFEVLDKELPLEKIQFLREKDRVVSSLYDEELVYDVDENLRSTLKILEEARFIQEVKKENDYPPKGEGRKKCQIAIVRKELV